MMSPSLEAPRRPTVSRAVISPRVWMAVTCLLLGSFAGFRYWREWQFRSLAVKSEAPPFHLADLPRTMGTWQGSEDSESQLDPEVARFAGASEHLVRGYFDEKSGEKAASLVLYGLATSVYMHTPEVCYPSAGFALYKGPVDKEIIVPGLKSPLRYRWAIYTKRIAGVSRYEETYHVFRHAGQWLPDVADRWKTFRYLPGLFKIQISHPVTSLEENGDGPCRSLLVETARQIESRLSGGAADPDAAKSEDPPTSQAAKPDATAPGARG